MDGTLAGCFVHNMAGDKGCFIRSEAVVMIDNKRVHIFFNQAKDKIIDITNDGQLHLVHPLHLTLRTFEKCEQ